MSNMKTAYIARETLAPGFPGEDVSAIVELMIADLELQAYEVIVGDLHKFQEALSQDAVTSAWERACSAL